MKTSRVLLFIFILSIGCTKKDDPMPTPDPDPDPSLIEASKSNIVFDYYFRADTITINAPAAWEAFAEFPLIPYYDRWMSVQRMESDSTKLIIYGGSELRQTTDLYADIAIRLVDNPDTTATRISVVRSAVPNKIFAFGGEGDDEFNSLTSLVLEGEYILVGSTSSATGDLTVNKGGKDFWVMKVTYDGRKIWSRSFGGSGDDVGNSIVLSFDGVGVDGFLVAGYTNSNDGDVSGNHGGRDAWLIKLDTAGNLLWQKTLGTAGDDAIVKVFEGADPNALVNGVKDGDQWIFKMDDDGDIVWEQTFGSSGADLGADSREFEYPRWFAGSGTVADEDVADKPTTSEDAWIVKTLPDGTELWRNYIAGAGIDRPVLVGGSVMYGNTTSADIFPDFNGTQNIFSATFNDNDGQIVSKKIIRHTAFDELKDISGTRHGYSSLYVGRGLVPGANGNGDASFEGFVLEILADGSLSSDRVVGGPGSIINSIRHGGGAGRSTFVGATAVADEYGNTGKNGWFGWIECR